MGLRRIVVGWLAAALLLAGVPGVESPPLNGAPPLDDSRSVEMSGREFVTPLTQQSISRGLAYLSTRQHEDGSFGSGSQYRKNVAVTALCGMAFLSAGHTPGRGQYGAQVLKAVRYLLSRTQSNGYIVEEEVHYHGPMYGHGFATTFLAESYGMCPDRELRKELRTKLGLAVNLIISTQNKQGGWRYDPEPKAADVSVTVCQMMALRAARNCGIHVPKSTIDNSVKYLTECQNGDGGFRYQLGQRAGSMFPRSAACIVGMFSAGVYQGNDIDRALEFVLRYQPGDDPLRYESNYFYGHYYAVQAMWHTGGAKWRGWYPAIRNDLLRRQSPTGHWSEPDRQICPEYNTAMACLILQMPNNYLPIFQR